MDINNNGTIIKVYPSDESELTTGVMTSGKVVLHFRSDQDIKLEQGATIEFLGNTYTLVYPQETKKLWRGYLEYIATFYSSAEQLKHKLLKDPSNIARTSFVFAGSPTDFATLVARSMGHKWSVGNCVATSYDKTIAFKEESCWAALGRVAEEFHTEWVVEGKSISLRKDERFKEDPLPLSYGKGNGFLSGVSQRGNTDNLPISRLYVLGSSRNIDPTKYGASTLHLPKSWSSERMRTDEAGNYIELIEGNGAEGAMELSDLYPHRVGVVSSVVVANEAKHFYDVIDSSIPDELNYNDYRIRGEKAILKFETGALAGRQFEIRQSETALSGYHHQERRFELIPSEQDGFIMPSKEWAPKAGDKYAVFGIALPQEYVTRAENELLKEAIRTLSERSLPQFTFEGEVDGIWAKRKWLEIGGKLVPGGHVLFSDPEFHPEGTVIRITSMAQKVNNPTAPSITLSTALVGGSLWNVLNRAEAQEVLSQKRDRELQRSQRQSYEQALEHIGMVERAVEGVEGFSKRIKPSVIETMGLLVGSQATQLDFVERYGSLKSVPMAINYNPTDKRITISNAFIRHQTIGITSITNARKPTDYRYWSVARYTSPALTDTEQSYYIYAKVEREGKGGNYLLSPDPLPFETTTHYHLLIGTLSSVIDGDRAYNRLYGFSMVTPGQILTDTISSANGNMTIDLQNGSIISDQIEFRRPDGSTKSVEEVITDTVQVGGRNLALRTQQPRRLSAGYAYYMLSEYLTKDTDYTIQFDVEVLTPPEDNRFMVYFAYSTHLFTRVYIPYERGKTHYSATLKTPNKDGAIVDNLKSVYIYPHGWGNGGDTVSDVAFSNVKLERGTVATDWTPAPEDIQADIDKEAQARATAVQEINAGLSNANTLIATLEKTAKELKEGKLDTKDLPDLQYLLNALQKGDTKIAGGLLLTNSIILSEPTTGQVMATISGTANTGANALRLGIQYPDSVALATLLDSGKVSFGSDVTTDEQREQSLLKQGYSVIYKLANIRNWIVRSTASTGELTTLRNDGTGHIGQLHFDSDRIVVAPIGDISKAFMEFGRNVMKQTIQEVLRSNAVDTSTTLTNVRVSDSQTVTRTFRVMNDNTSVTIDMDLVIDREVGERLYRQHPYPKQMIARLDDEKGLFAYNFQDWEEDVDIYDPSDGAVYYPVIYASTISVHKTVILHQGTHTLTFYTNFGRGGANNIKVSQKYSTNYRQTSFSDRGMRIFGGGNSFVDFNHDHPQGTTFATIGGGLKVDYIDTPGVPLCGVMVDKSGTVIKSFGRYRNRSGTSQPQASYNYRTKSFTVYHSIPHDRYIPLVNPFDDPASPVISDVSAYSFKVRFTLQAERYNGWAVGFSYIAFKAE